MKIWSPTPRRWRLVLTRSIAPDIRVASARRDHMKTVYGQEIPDYVREWATGTWADVLLCEERGYVESCKLLDSHRAVVVVTIDEPGWTEYEEPEYDDWDYC